MLPAPVHSVPVRAAVRVGGRCNSDCAFCAANSSWAIRAGTEIGADLAAAARAGARALDLGGGELTAHPELRAILRMLKRVGLPWTLATNGRLFSVEGVARAFAEAGLTAAEVSLHGPPPIDDAVANVPSYAQKTAGMGALRAAGVRVRVSTVVTRPLVEGASPEAFAAEVAALGIDEVTLRAVELEPELEERWDALVPELAATATWMADFRRAFRGTVRVLGVDEALLPAVGHLRFGPGELVPDFDVERCPYRARARTAGAGLDGLLVADGETVRLWRLEGQAPEPVLLAARLNQGQVWRTRAAGAPQPLVLARPCRECHRLPGCPALFEVASEPAELPLPQPREGLVEHLTREIWLVEPGAPPPWRPGPLEPAVLLRALRADGWVPVSYEQPSGERRQPFRARVVRREEVLEPLVAARHAGVSLQVTESCMCRCVMCNLVGYFKTPMMSLPRALRTLEEAALLGVELADLFGGEVTLRKDLFQLIRAVRWLGMECMFITTGYYLTPDLVARLAEAGVNRVVVSIDGSRPEIHDAIRQLPGLYERAVRGLGALAQGGRFEAFASTVVLSENLWDLPELVRQSARLGIRKHEFFLPVSGPVSSTLPRWPTRDEMESLLDDILPEMEEVAREAGVEIDFRPELRRWELPREEAIGMVTSGLYNIHARDEASRCRAPGFNLFIAVNGNVYPCDMPALIHRDTALGNVGEASLLDIVTSEAMRAFAARAGHYDACRMCVGRYEALGPAAG